MSLKAFVDLMSFLSGLVLIFNETLLQSPTHPTMLIMGAVMTGFPVVVRTEPRSNTPKINRNTDLRIAQRPPEHPIGRQVRKDMEQLEAYDKLC